MRCTDQRNQAFGRQCKAYGGRHRVIVNREKTVSCSNEPGGRRGPRGPTARWDATAKRKVELCCGLDLNQHTLSGTSPSS
jgi:hypothetical protein